MPHEQHDLTGISRWRMARRLGAALSGLVFLCALALGLTALLNAQTAQTATTSQAAAIARLAQARELSESYGDIKVDIIQVQQFLTDISATRGQNGLDDGFSEAAKYAKRFPNDIARARAAAQSLKSADALKTLADVEHGFPAYYELGQRLSHAYIADGPPGGNRLMPTFDEASDHLWSSLESVKLAVDKTTQTAVKEQAVVASKQTEQSQFALMVQGLACLLIIGAGLAIMAYVKRSLLQPLDQATGAIRRLADGDMSATLAGADRADEVGDLARAFNVFRATLVERLELEAATKAAASRAEADRERTEREILARSEALVVGSLGQGLSALAQGDLSYRINEALPPAFARLRDDFNQTSRTLQAMVNDVVECSGEIRTGAGEIGDSARDLATRSSSQAAGVEQTAAAVTELTQTVKHSSELARAARDKVLAAAEVGLKSGEDASRAVAAMDAINSSSTRISAIISVIDEIAFQTNLLALNAGVEAARAGEAGRGFAVVASEVRSLAQKSAGAAREIKTLILESGTHVSSGVALVGAAGASMQDIAHHVSDVAALIDSIAHSASEQSLALSSINSALNQLDQVTQHNAVMASQSSEAGRALLGEASRLAGLVERFHVSSDAAELAPQRPIKRA